MEPYFKAIGGALVVAGFLAVLDPLRIQRRAWLYSAAVVIGAVAGPVAHLWPGGESLLPKSVLLVAAMGLAVLAPFAVGAERRRARWFVLLALLLGLLTVLGSGPAGGPGRLLSFLTEFVGLELQQAELVNFVVRKAVHVLAYGVLAWSAGQAAGSKPGSQLLAGYGWAVPHACLDEWHQTFSAGTRTGAFGDVLLDVLGMTVLLAPQWRAWWAEKGQKPSGSS
ncbi:MAG: VanZ family protein [Fimbriimonadaceae bacterium]|nr:VanZ family protein [Fimbriimonadaceae bacterium]QYK59536.1 MAG: VanZ family protein [Fimbriimonadaceae bacterium]